ncbi:hypothetical protein BDY19DRAFT_995714 [Irpex rosettiformis]|uniref:Uncharacterized protein n=1 Tax=Irpex rosettiformis TaxID=378272 RepID=A0ACB8TXK6_9APHY|nr:hypothetical protein BDY19DRAFT_995714 [Irpex rosettiformis]
MAQQGQLQEISQKHLSHTMEEDQDPPTDLNQVTITKNSAALTFRHEQPMIKEQEIKIDRPDLPDDDEPSDRLHVYLAWICDVTHEEVILKTPEPMDTDKDNYDS